MAPALALAYKLTLVPLPQRGGGTELAALVLTCRTHLHKSLTPRWVGPCLGVFAPALGAEIARRALPAPNGEQPHSDGAAARGSGVDARWPARLEGQRPGSDQPQLRSQHRKRL